MGKNRSKKKGTKPPNPNILPFLQEMFPNIEKDIVEIVFEQNEYDEEKTMQLLSEMGDDSKPFGEFVDDISNLEEAVDNFSNIELSSSDNIHSHTKNEPFISTDDCFPSSTNSTFMSTQQSPPDIPNTTYLMPKRSSKNIMSSKSPRMAPSTTGETGEFLSSMFPELDPTMVSLLYEENGSDVGKTVESLLSIVFMNHSGASNDDEEEAEALDEVENEALAEVASDVEGEEGENQDYESESDEIVEDTDNSFEAEDANSEDDGEEIEEFEDMSDKSDIYHQFESGEFKFDIPQPIEEETPNETVSVASKSEFIQNLKLLAELFPETPRTLLALELDEHDGNLEKTIASCCRADPEYLQKLSGEKGIPLPLPEQQQQPIVKKTHPTPVNHILKPTWIRKGASRTDIKYVPPPPAPSTTTPTKVKTRSKTKGKTTKPKPSNVSSSNRLKPMDLAAKLKLKQLKEKFSFVDADILEAVFVQNGHKVHTTLVCLYDIYPHLRDASTSRGSPSSSSYSIREPSSPEELLTRTKRDKSSTAPTTTTTTTTTTTATDKPRKKRSKPATAEEGEDDGDFITVSYRKKKSENSGGNASAPVTPKKVLDSDDIETTYQSYREKAVQAGEMRNHLFMQAVSAYQSGDGARAKALSNRAREYNEMMKEAHQQACYQIFNDCNARFDTLASVDLHGLHVAESLQVLSQLLDIHTQMGENSRKPKKLKVITGVGKHSVKGIAKIKPAVKNFLRSKGYKFQETDAGVITISLSR